MAIQIKTPADRSVSRNGVTASIQWSSGFGPEWSARFQRVQTMFDQEVLRRTDPYVPLDSGLLKDSALLASDIGGGLLEYATPYASGQYYDTADSRPYDTQRGGHWGDRMKANNLDSLAEFARKAVGSK